jgi:hypothetical protein
MSDTFSFMRFKNTPLIVSVDGNNTYGLFKKYSFLDEANLTDNDVIKVTVDSTIAGRPDLISSNLYSTSIYDWVIIMFNKVQNPLNWPKVGSVIKAPRRSVILTSL